MSHFQSGKVSPIAHGDRYLTAAASLLVGGAFFGLWFWLLPQWRGFRADLAGAAHWHWLAALPSVLGFAVAVRCVWDFGWTGRGTPAPFAPPQRLVVVGLYRYVRNPMYLGFAVGWVGLWVVFGHMFVALYEEPTLRNKFGAPYEEYCSNVDRWLPRFPGWDKPQQL